MVYVDTRLMLINEMWTQMSSMEFIDGVYEFIKVAENHKYGGSVPCPCKNYKNEKDCSSSRTIHSNLISSGFMPNYYVWTKHGESGIMLDNNKKEEGVRISDFTGNYGAFFYDTAMGEPEEDTEGHVVEDDLGQMLCEGEEVFFWRENCGEVPHSASIL